MCAYKPDGVRIPPFSIASTGVQWPVKMNSKLCAVLTLLFLLASVCLAADKPVSDDAIVDQVRIKLSADYEVKGGALTVDCKAGVVTLGGTVETSRQKSKATT